MKTIFQALALLLAAALSPAAFAVLAVDSMNYPVWVERNSSILPVAPGDRLRDGDVVRTGKTGRVWLSVEDGSVIKLGQRARFAVKRAAFNESGNETVLDAAFDLLQGAFRFTSGFFAAARRTRHQVDFRVGAVTAGVRGTDIWGLSGDERDFVALLEGRIEVSSDGDAPQIMDQALTLYQKNQGQPADAVQPVELAVVQSLAPQTELDAGVGIASAGGAYQVVLQSLRTDQFVETSLERFRSAGFAVSTRSAEVGGVSYTRIVLRGLVDRTAAAGLRDLVAREFEIVDAWLSIDG